MSRRYRHRFADTERDREAAQTRQQRRSAQAMAASAKVPALEGHGGSRGQGNNITLPRGTRAEYLVRRLKRDLDDELVADQWPRDPRAAAIAAGVLFPEGDT
jgi:hypothetical protein